MNEELGEGFKDVIIASTLDASFDHHELSMTDTSNCHSEITKGD